MSADHGTRLSTEGARQLAYTLSRGHLRPPGRHERAPLAAEFPAPAHAQSGEPDRQDVALLMLEVLSADGQDGPDRAPPRRRTGGLNGGPQSRTESGSRRSGAHCFGSAPAFSAPD